MKQADILRLREAHFGRGLSVSYHKPITITRGEGAYLYDENNKRYLDCVNNVCHVGHCHPKVVAAAQEQLGKLNTNTRYLHPLLAQYVKALTDLFPGPLSVCYLVNSGSEAVDLALRLARCHTQAEKMIAVEAAYHGHVSSALAVSAYKFNGPGGGGCPPSTLVVPAPDVYRGLHRAPAGGLGEKYARHVEQVIDGLKIAGEKPAGFICESMLSVGGQIMLPEGYLTNVYKHVRDAGGVCIADEVQIGFGRIGSHMWAFELQEVVPDIVVLGKPIGNGHPLAAVITTPEVAASFDNGMEYFNTFGGNPVSCRIGLAVLEVIEAENLRAHAKDLGEYLLSELESMKQRFPIIGDVRGKGLFLGMELVRDSASLEPAKEEAYRIVEKLKDRGVLLSVDGPLCNVLKFKPPMVFSRADAEFFLANLEAVLSEI
ncbi:MAG: aminotransferase class III-fold pyridoxal phosphate-dependent enzyme [Gammaproteobacteria bacterium]|nr:aminotransferase class III-fold pyridoxal phosphate-dependent enzyme [Gammaproteobacteria bacterium]